LLVFTALPLHVAELAHSRRIWVKSSFDFSQNCCQSTNILNIQGRCDIEVSRLPNFHAIQECGDRAGQDIANAMAIEHAQQPRDVWWSGGVLSGHAFRPSTAAYGGITSTICAPRAWQYQIQLIGCVRAERASTGRLHAKRNLSP
jgi:hypothetical protein